MKETLDNHKKILNDDEMAEQIVMLGLP